MPALPYQRFSSLYDLYSDKKIALIEVGDSPLARITHHVNRELLIRLGIKVQVLQCVERSLKLVDSDCQHVVISCGSWSVLVANLGLIETLELQGRNIALIPTALELTQNESALDQVPRLADWSLRNRTQDLPADTLLAFESRNFDAIPRLSFGVIAGEEESILNDDPCCLTSINALGLTPYQAYELVSQFSHLVTDSPTVAMIGCAANRSVTCITEGMPRFARFVETHLSGMGCHGGSLEVFQTSEVMESTQNAKSFLADTLSRRTVPHIPLHLPHRVRGQLQESPTAIETVNGDTLSLNSSAIAIVNDLDQGKTPVEIVDDICVDTGIPRSDVAQSIRSLITSLRSHEAIEIDRRTTLTPYLEIQVLPIRFEEATAIAEAELWFPDRPMRRLWFSVSSTHAKHLSTKASPWILAAWWPAAIHGWDIRISGADIDEELVKNLKQYTKVWSSWKPRKLYDVEVFGDYAEHSSKHEVRTLATFSGGVDSCYAAFDLLERKTDKLTLVTVHGFDVPVSETQAFARVDERLNKILFNTSVDRISVQTNIRSFSHKWDEYHGMAIGSVFSMLSQHSSVAYLPGTVTSDISASWGSHHATDHLMSSSNLSIHHHGATTSRLKKIQRISKWTSAIENLHVCWNPFHYGRNCGRCQKCVLLQLSLRALNLPLLCFEDPLSSTDLAKEIPTHLPGAVDLADYLQISSHCDVNRIETVWSRALRSALKAWSITSADTKRIHFRS